MTKTALVSFPRCGRHVMHSLLSAAYGVPPGHMDRANPEAHTRDLVVSHDVNPSLEGDDRKCIVMIRGPLECLHSYMVLMHPNELTFEKFKWALFCNDGPRNQCGWVNHWKQFVQHHVLTPDSRYANERFILPYQRLINDPRGSMQEVTKFLGGQPNLDRAMGVKVQKQARSLELWNMPGLVDSVFAAVEPEVAALLERGLL